jgi:hypothetical protein
VENTLIEIGSKWLKKQKRRSEVRERDTLNEKTEEDISTIKRDHGQPRKKKKTPIYALEHLVGKKDR